jgi:perosamine synthetase
MRRRIPLRNSGGRKQEIRGRILVTRYSSRVTVLYFVTCHSLLVTFKTSEATKNPLQDQQGSFVPNSGAQDYSWIENGTQNNNFYLKINHTQHSMPKQTIHMSLPDIDESDIAGVVEVIRSGRLALGPKTEDFEKLIAEYIGVKHGIAVSSGTAALHLIVRALGIGKDDEVLVPSFTFAASVNAFLYEGARPVFLDIENKSYNLDPADIEKKITKRTKAIMVVDVFGHPAEWDEINKIADEHGLKVIDDSCEAIGAEYKGEKIGKFGDAAAFAFYPNKQMTTGEGGMIVTDNDEIARLCRSMRNQGRGEMGAWLEHDRLGYNYRLDELSASLGVSQFHRLESFLQKRESVAKLYSERLKNFDWVSVPFVSPDVRMSWFVYVVTLAKGLNRDRRIEELEKEGIPARGYFSPVHRQQYIKEMYGDLNRSLPVTESIADRTLALPFHNNLTVGEINWVVEVLERVATKPIV